MAEVDYWIQYFCAIKLYYCKIFNLQVNRLNFKHYNLTNPVLTIRSQPVFIGLTVKTIAIIWKTTVARLTLDFTLGGRFIARSVAFPVGEVMQGQFLRQSSFMWSDRPA